MARSSGPTEPSRPTVKRLYALSGNRCAYPDCPTRLVDKATGSVVGQVCHIKGEKPLAARYDSAQSDLERHDFENLIVLCNVHHKIIDDNSQEYPIERLLKMKSDHESKGEGKEPLDEQASDKFASGASIYFLQHGSVIHATNLTGGQVAHSITNVFHSSSQAEPPRIGSRPGVPQVASRLSQDAFELLRKAESGDGTILVANTDAGLAILAGNTQVNETGNARSEALYRQIIKDLSSGGLITQTEAVGHVVMYNLTHSAYELMDKTK